MGSPWMNNRPRVGYSSPAIIRSMVVLPQPDGPMKQTISFSRRSRETLSTAVNLPPRYSRLTAVARIATRSASAES